MKKGLFSRLVSCILVLAMLVQTVPLNVLAQEADIHTETRDATITQEQVGPQETESTTLGNGDYVTDDAYIVNEIVENRTEFTKEFQLSNGLHMAAVYPEAIHYNNDGEWEDIDNTLRLSEDDESASYINTAGIWDIELPELLAENKAVTVTKDGYTLQFFMAGELHSNPDAEVMSESEDTSMEESLSDLQMPSDTATEPTTAETAAEEVDTTEPIATEASIVDTTEIVSDTETEPATQQDDSEEDETDPSETVAIFEQETEENEAFKGTAVEETAAEEELIQETVAETTSISDSEKAIPDESDIKEDFNEALEKADKEETVPTEVFENANNSEAPVDAPKTSPETGSPIIFERAEAVKGQVQAIDMSSMLESAEHPEMFSEKLRSRLKYAEVYSNTDIIYDLTSNQLKESIVISEYDPTLCGYQYSLNVGKLTPVLLDDGKIELYDEAGKKLVMEMPAPYLYDDAGSYCYDITVALEENGDTYALTYTLPQTWMADTERQWPVVLDPIVEATKTNSSITNRTVSERPAGATEPATPDLACGFDQYLDVARFYIKYDTTTLPQLTSADVIINATITLNMVDRRGDPLDIEVHTVTENWESNQMTWDSQPSFDKTIEDVTNCYENHQDYYWNITDIVRSWYTGDNFGMVFKASDYVESREEYIWKSFYSVNSSPATYPPVLTITYRNSNGLESYWDYTSSSAGRAGTGYVNNYTGNLVWVHNDIGFGGNRMPVSINHVYNSNDSLINYYGMGYGWRTNYNQRIYYWSSEHSAVGNCYVWEDGDGTAHYFIKESGNVYKDEDGLELTFEVVNEDSWKYTITDKYGNQSFFDSNGRLVKLKDNQEEENSIKISYTATTGKLISTIRDGAGRVYSFTYSGNLLDKISYLGTDNTEHGYVSYTYTNSKLSSITYMDSKSCGFTYTTNNLMSSATDIDGYKLEYEYYTVEAGLPNRIEKISEIDGGVSGGSMIFEYAQNQTKVTDISGNVQIMQFNNFGNTVSIQDDQGRAMYAKYALNNLDETVNYENPKGNQLRWISKLQNTVGNVLDDSSFEKSTVWTASSSAVTCSATTYSSAVHGNMVLKLNRATAGAAAGVYSPSFSVGANETYTFSAYIKTGGLSAYLELNDGNTSVTSEVLAANSDWTRLEVSYSASANKTVNAWLKTTGSGTIYMDCVQVEKAATASRYNLVQNGDFRYTSDWSATSGRITAENAGIESAPALELSSDVYSITGSPSSKIRVSQTVSVSGQKDDCFVLAGWAKGSSAPLEESGSHSNREFGIIATFNNTDGTTTKMEPISFNPYVENWQYVSVPLVAKQAYSSIKIELAYDYNVNTVYFDGIQLFKEMFGHSYTYDENGNVTSVIDLQEQTTTYEYDEETNDLLTEILPTGAKLTYTYDDFHNVKTATTETGVQYSFDYDQYGNNTSVSIGSGNSKITSEAEYSSDGNCLVSTKDASGNVTTYQYNVNTNVLDWVQYPGDTAAPRTKYEYDEMYRLASATANTSGGSNLFAEYGYSNDLLSYIETASTTYSFTYNKFDLRSKIEVGNRNLASYIYKGINDADGRFVEQQFEDAPILSLVGLDYGNGDKVQYTYDKQGRVTTQSYEDGDTISYKYDNNGALATITDSETGITTTYYYDFTDRLMKYVESASDYNHSVAYEYDLYNNMLALVEIVNGSTYTTTYDYDKENRVTSINVDNDISETYTYDNWGRVNKKTVKNNNSAVLSETIGYVSVGSNTTKQVGSLTVDSSSYDVSFKYTYDKNGNILSVVSGGKTTSYEYDSSNQLIRENNQAAGKTWVWAYDNAGNILSRKQYAYTTADDVGTEEETVLYDYNDHMGWGDLLTSYDGNSIVYNEIGNPTERDGWILTWKHGRELASISNADANPSNQVTTDFVYNADGLRTRKTVTTNVYENSAHTVTFVADGVTVDTRTVPDGHTLTDAEYPAVPEKSGYTGSWPDHSDPITSDTTITAVYTAIETAPEDTTHTVTFKVSYGSYSYGSTLKTMTVENGYVLTDADYPTSRMSYYTITWNKYTSPVTSDITVTGTYTRPSTTTTHTVTFVADGVTVDTLTVSNGHTLTDDEYPAVPEKSGYTGSWPEHNDPITADTTITAVYTAIATEPEETEPEGTTHTVTFKVSYGSSSYGTTLKTMTVADGYVLTDADYPTSSMGYYTIKWNKYTSPITSDITVNGTYSWGSTSSEETEEEPDLVISDEYTAPTLGGKLVSSVTEQYDYVYNGSTLTQLTKTTTSGSETQTEVLHFSYDAGGMPMAVTYNGTDYYYVTNLQGDVMAILDSAGKAVVNYTYDAWGSILTTTGTMAESLGETNPLRYRGYVYDSELGLYYLQSRYYDPEMGRFLNADTFAATGQGLLGNNMFAYCGNNPTIRNDTEGNSWAVVGIGAAVSIITGLANGYSSYASGGKFWPAFWIGIGAGSIGYALSLTTKNPLTLVSIRSLTSLGSNLLTTEANNGRITAEDWVVSAWDAIMDGVFSTFTYFYNPFSSDFLSNIFNAVVDGFTDITETWLYNSPLEEQSSASPTTRYSGRIQPYNTVKSNKRILLY